MAFCLNYEAKFVRNKQDNTRFLGRETRDRIKFYNQTVKHSTVREF